MDAPITEEPNEDDRIQRRRLQALLDQVLAVQDATHLPSLLTRNIEFILSLDGPQGVALIGEILRETKATRGDEAAKEAEQALDLILSSAEDFVEQAARIDQENKQRLGQILRLASNMDQSARDREQAVDALLAENEWTPGFLRHLENECERIASAPSLSRDSARLLETLRIIQARVVEELGQGLGEAAVVLGQLVHYDKQECIAVLEAGLTVRGADFGEELLALTSEALEGLSRVQADPDLVERVQLIDERLQRHLREKQV